MNSEGVRAFIRSEISKGLGIDDVKQKLKAQGYSHELIEAASLEFFAEEHMGEILKKPEHSHAEEAAERFMHNFHLDHFTLAVAFAAILYAVTRGILSSHFEESIVRIGLKSIQFFLETLILYFILGYVQRNYNPEQSIELRKVTFKKALSYIIVSGLIILLLRTIIPTEGSSLLAGILFFILIFVRYLLLMLYFNVFSFFKFTLIAVFFAVTSWVSTFAINILLDLLIS